MNVIDTIADWFGGLIILATTGVFLTVAPVVALVRWGVWETEERERFGAGYLTAGLTGVFAFLWLRSFSLAALADTIIPVIVIAGISLAAVFPLSVTRLGMRLDALFGSRKDDS